ncbi:MAG TPA: polysaccharide biosynthesis/export family protein, partial [Pseudomonas sp.]|nr:polysaccharide biosynthesis/export family protein [Pseudomonas sp.]
MARLLISMLCVLCAWSGASVANDQGASYLLSPGDKVLISVWQEDTLRQETVVLPDGSITFPLAGRIDVAGLDVTAVAKKVTDGL